MGKHLVLTISNLLPKNSIGASFMVLVICCCSENYLQSKIIVARLRPFLDKLISPLQKAFVRGKKGIDNVIIAQEIIHSLGKKRKERGRRGT